MNHRLRGAGAGVSIHHCITKGTKASVALIFNIDGDSAQEAVHAVVKATSNGYNLTNDQLSSIEMEAFKAREVWLAGCGENANDFFEFEQRQINYSSLSIYKGSRDDTVRVTLPDNIVKNKSQNNKYKKYLELKLEVELSSPLLRAILRCQNPRQCEKRKFVAREYDLRINTPKNGHQTQQNVRLTMTVCD